MSHGTSYGLSIVRRPDFKCNEEWMNDTILAATVAATGGKIYTQNLKHYPMPDIAVGKGW